MVFGGCFLFGSGAAHRGSERVAHALGSGRGVDGRAPRTPGRACELGADGEVDGILGQGAQFEVEQDRPFLLALHGVRSDAVIERGDLSSRQECRGGGLRSLER